MEGSLGSKRSRVNLLEKKEPTARHLGPLDKHLGKQGCNCRLQDHKIFNPCENRPVNIRPSVLFMFNRIQFCIVICFQFIICYLSLVICNLASSFKFSVLARQPSRAADPLLRSSRGGGGGAGGTPPVYWHAGGGDLYI